MELEVFGNFRSYQVLFKQVDLGFREKNIAKVTKKCINNEAEIHLDSHKTQQTHWSDPYFQITPHCIFSVPT